MVKSFLHNLGDTEQFLLDVIGDMGGSVIGETVIGDMVVLSLRFFVRKDGHLGRIYVHGNVGKEYHGRHILTTHTWYPVYVKFPRSFNGALNGFLHYYPAYDDTFKPKDGYSRLRELMSDYRKEGIIDFRLFFNM